MYCEKCGSRLGPNDVFCAGCGAKVGNTPIQGGDKKNNQMPIIIALVAVGVLLLAAIVFVVTQIFLGSDSEVIEQVITPSPTVTIAPEVIETPMDTPDGNTSATVTVVPTVTPPTVAQAPSTGGEFILPYSNSMYYSASDLYGLSKWELSIARNEIYARHGRMFTKADLRQYFNAQPWYIPRYTAEEFDAMQKYYFNAYEKYNIELITDVEKALGYR